MIFPSDTPLTTVMQAAEDIRTDFEFLGYDSISECDVMLRLEDGQIDASFDFYLIDDFQKDIDYRHRVKHGTVTVREISELNDWPSRERRELEVMLRQQGETTVLKDMIRSTRGREYMERLLAERSRFRQITGPVE